MRLILTTAAALLAFAQAGASEVATNAATGALTNAANAVTEVWTNAANKAFAGNLKSIDRKVAVFTNSNGVVTEMPLSALSKETVRRARRQLGAVDVPPMMAATLRQAKGELKDIDNMLADGRIKPEEAAERRAAVFRAVRQVAKMKGQPAAVAEAMVKKLSE